jgi:hypothetical protein
MGQSRKKDNPDGSKNSGAQGAAGGTTGNGRGARPKGKGGFPTEANEAARLYLAKGLAPIPLLPRSKDPGYDGWPQLRLTDADLDRYFPPGDAKNIGILNGEPSHNTADVDLDCPQAVRAAARLLPGTGWIFGRKTAPRSHHVYRTDRPLAKAQVEYRDLDGTMLVELRGTGGLTIFPPSTHRETGEPIGWEEFGDPADVELDALRQAVGEVAAAALLARHWPSKGSRDSAAMALAGGLTRAGWAEERVSRLCRTVAEAAGDEEAHMRAGKASGTARKLEEGEKTTGWPSLEKLLKGDGRGVVCRVRDWLGMADKAPTEIALPAEPPWPDPPAEEAFHGLAGKIVRAIEPASEADPAALLVQVLVAFGNAAGRGAHFAVEGDRHHGNEFAVLVGKSSKARKGTSWGRVESVMQEADRAWATDQIETGLSSGEGLIWRVRDPITKRDRVKDRGGPVRYEEVEADPGIADKRLFVYEPEFANVLKQTERQGNTLSAVLRLAWDGKDLRSMVKNSPARATGALVSLIGHITAEELRRYLSRTETANGFANRILWVCVKRSKLLPEGGTLGRATLAGLQAQLGQALAFARSAGEVRRDEEARELWGQIYGELSDDRPGLAGALLGRAEAHTMRLAMLYALLDRSSAIRVEHLQAALAVWDYVERSVGFIFGDSLGDATADELLRLLRSRPTGLTRTEIRDYFQRHASAEEIGRALGLLTEHRLARQEQQQTGGRPSERWFATGGKRG